MPVIRDGLDKGLRDIASELETLSTAAREKKLTPDQISGASFTVSSLGRIGGTGFTPIINAPEVAILGSLDSLCPETLLDQKRGLTLEMIQVSPVRV